ncbi:hypothetical protein STEG23_010865 [Scotinomys teguina]
MQTCNPINSDVYGMRHHMSREEVDCEIVNAKGPSSLVIFGRAKSCLIAKPVVKQIHFIYAMFIHFYVYKCFNDMYTCTPQVFVVPVKGQKMALDPLERA